MTKDIEELGSELAVQQLGDREVAEFAIEWLTKRGWRPPGEPDDPAENRLGGFSGDTDTSRLAALMAYPRTGIMRHDLLCRLAVRPLHGGTSEELAEESGALVYSVKPRLTELKAGGWIKVLGQRPGESAAPLDVYGLTEAGLNEMLARGDVTLDEVKAAEGRGR